MTVLIVKSIVSLLFVCVLLYGVLKIISKFNFGVFGGLNKDKSAGISIDSVLYVDSSSKIVNFSCKNKNYLILIGKNNNLLIDVYEETKL